MSDFNTRDYETGYKDGLRSAEASITVLRAEVELHQRSFDLRWDASMRAIARWQEAHPGNDLNWPDHADLVVWLLERDAALRAEVERLTARIRELEEARAALKGETINRTQEDIEADRQAVLNRMRALIGSTAPRADFEWQQLQHKLQDLMVESWSILPLPKEPEHD